MDVDSGEESPASRSDRATRLKFLGKCFQRKCFYRSSVRSLRHSVSFGLSPIIGIQEVATHIVGS